MKIEIFFMNTSKTIFVICARVFISCYFQEFNDENLLACGPLPNQPTLFMCKLIRKLYSKQEIEDGIQDDERLDKIKSNFFVHFSMKL